MKTAVFAALLLAGPSHADGPVSAAHAGLPPALAKAAAAFDHAQVAGDRAALERLLADDYVLVNSGGKHQDKASFIADLTATGFSMQPFTVEDEVIRAWRGGAVLSGTATLQGTSEGKPFRARLHFADVWRERDGAWQVVFTEARRADTP